MLFLMGHGEGNQSNIASSFNSARDSSLMPGTVSRNPARNNLAPFCYKKPKHGKIFVVYSKTAVSTESAYLLFVECLLLSISKLPLFQKNTSLNESLNIIFSVLLLNQPNRPDRISSQTDSLKPQGQWL